MPKYHGNGRSRRGRRALARSANPLGLILICLLTSLPSTAQRPSPAPSEEWPAYGRDPGGSRFSPLTQINRENVGRLRVAWTYRTGDNGENFASGGKRAFEATPLMVDGTLYLSTPTNRVVALDPATGARRWAYDPKVDPSRDYSEVTSRGVATWADSTRPLGARGHRRIFVGTIDARLIALDAETGAPCVDFGTGGQVDLTRGLRLVDAGDYQVTSPPAIIGDLVVVGSSIGDNRRTDVERGVVRAFDARTGALRWSWDPIPLVNDDPAAPTWKDGSAARTGAANAWSIISADAERGLVFVPTGSPSPDFYGGERKGSNLYANSVVALRASTGKVVWWFQGIHHDLWDYDIASQPTLLTLRRDGAEIPAVAMTTKVGHLFVLHRETGKPLFPVEERSFPKSDVPGEEAAPTQPVPTTLPLLAPQGLRAEDAWGATPTDRDWCRDRIKSLRSEGVFTPPSLQGTLVFPGNVGGVAWGGAAFDPARQWLVVNTNRLVTVVKLVPRADLKAARAATTGDRLSGEFGTQSGTPYAMYREILASPSRLPCNAPPWGTLAAIDLVSGAKRWEVPLGAFELPGGGDPILGSPNLGGPMVTAGGLVFIAAAMDGYLRAFDVESGAELWKSKLPAGGQATPMTFGLPNGKQYVVIAAGGHGKLGTPLGDSVVAFALP
jgi:quinoprotein glucose dehydrogenase